ncbi:DUF4266 domain-containing protein [Piscinibacter sp. XHJ-5]|uniref:DUF4266 domain-containing protein n=1 Tax=Piscinibacter sp. XHJ-5 TaxID=3037797 RepID=UPI002452FEF9|nr:DUF4266 domain-containing protein [Piscinibacter sp. XHJ-5]
MNTHPVRSAAMTAAVLIGCMLLGGCARLQPWVKPYEREKLADPIMQFSRDSLVEKHREHVRVVREGARGATGVQGGGCGCN